MTYYMKLTIQKNQFVMTDGNESSNNIIANINLNGPIFNDNKNVLRSNFYDYINPEKVKSYLEELKQIKDEFGDDRYSEIIEYSESKAFSQEEILSAEPVTVVLSQAGWIRSAKGHDINPETLAFRGEDALKHFANGRNNQMANFFDSTGKVFSISAHTLPSARGMESQSREESVRNLEFPSKE